ncbi:MAG: mechanosensitive ion channel family protein [Oscillospiraceae bacterium]|nr:mechanosensitive ion channel family protein [Oscillospiraceae bacterium]
MTEFLRILRQFATGRLAAAVLTAVIGILAIKVVLKVLKTAFSKLDPAFAKLLLGVAKPVLYVLLCLIVATSLGIDVTSIVALASVLTLAISLSLQNALGNIFGGFTLLNTKPFVTGDYVEIAGQSGTVKEVGLAYTRLATPDNKLIFIPNSAVVAAEIVNYSTTGTRRLAFDVRVAYDADPEAVIAALLEAGDIPAALTDPAPFAALDGYGEGTALYALRIWTAGDDYWDAHYEINKRIKAVFAEKGIAMSCSHLNVNVKQ